MIRRTIPASFVLFVLLASADAQGQRANVGVRIPRATLIAIVRAEDERRWDSDLRSLLTSDNPAIRKRAALATGRIGAPDSVAVLAEMLVRERDQDVRSMVAFAIGETELPGGAYALTEAIKAENAAVRARAVEALGKIVAALKTSNSPNNSGDERLEMLSTAIYSALNTEKQRPQPDRTVILLGLTAVLRARLDGAGPVVSPFLDNPDPAIVATALNTIARLRVKNGNERVRQLLNSPDPVVRANAARVIGAAEHKEAFDDLLAKALNDSDLRVRVSGIRALASLKDVRAAQPLLDKGKQLLGGDLTYAVDDKIGIAACDEFIARYAACVNDKVPESARAQLNQSMKQWQSFWKQLAANPQTKNSLGTACSQAAAQQEIALAAYGCTFDRNEILEIVTTLGSLLRDSKSADAMQWLRKVRASFNTNAPEVEIALARIDPTLYVAEEAKFNVRSLPTLAQGIREIATIKKTRPELETKGLTAWMHDVLTCEVDPSSGRAKSVRGKCPGPLAVSPLLEAYAAFQPDDLNAILLTRLQDNDVVVRSTAAELLGDRPASDANTRALIAALPRALGDKDLNDAALAILGALAKQKNPAANEAIKSALRSDDQNVRRRAVGLLKANDAGDFSDRIGFVKTRNTPVDYRRALARLGTRPTATIVTNRGAFTIEFAPEEAPLTVDNFIQLARRRYFNGQSIPRVVPNFVIQAGDPRGDQNGGPGYSIRCEINELPFERAAVGMALSGKDTGGSQWFVTHSPQPHLDGGYTVFGSVIRGMDVVDKIVRGDTIQRVIVNER